MPAYIVACMLRHAMEPFLFEGQLSHVSLCRSTEQCASIQTHGVLIACVCPTEDESEEDGSEQPSGSDEDEDKENERPSRR